MFRRGFIQSTLFLDLTTNYFINADIYIYLGYILPLIGRTYVYMCNMGKACSTYEIFLKTNSIKCYSKHQAKLVAFPPFGQTSFSRSKVSAF